MSDREGDKERDKERDSEKIEIEVLRSPCKLLLRAVDVCFVSWTTSHVTLYSMNSSWPDYVYNRLC